MTDSQTVAAVALATVPILYGIERIFLAVVRKHRATRRHP